MRKLLTFVLIVAAALAIEALAYAAHERTIVDLGGIANRDNWAIGINDRGDVVGIGAFQSSDSNETRGLWWHDGIMTELPPLPRDMASLAYAVNNRGQVVGASVRPDWNLQPVIWDEGRPLSLGMLPGGVSGEARGINDRGEIVGSVQLYDSWTGEQRAFIWRHGVMSDLLNLPPGSFSGAWGINNRGQVVGQAFGTIGSVTVVGGYVWDKGKIRTLGGLGGQAGNTIALAINERGEVTGMSQTTSEAYHAFLWRRGRMLDLGTLPGGGNSAGFGINDRGDVVGQADPGRGFVWSRGTMTDLGILGADFSRAESINNRGDIAGLGFDLAGLKHAIVWTSEPRRYQR